MSFVPLARNIVLGATVLFTQSAAKTFLSETFGMKALHDTTKDTSLEKEEIIKANVKYAVMTIGILLVATFVAAAVSEKVDHSMFPNFKTETTTTE